MNNDIYDNDMKNITGIALMCIYKYTISIYIEFE